jgi:hypothetical protein
MPLALAEHRNGKTDPFLWGLLPDNEIVLDHWARKFHVSARNAFSDSLKHSPRGLPNAGRPCAVSRRALPSSVIVAWYARPAEVCAQTVCLFCPIVQMGLLPIQGPQGARAQVVSSCVSGKSRPD